jgi:peroxiredoxin
MTLALQRTKRGWVQVTLLAASLVGVGCKGSKIDPIVDNTVTANAAKPARAGEINAGKAELNQVAAAEAQAKSAGSPVPVGTASDGTNAVVGNPAPPFSLSDLDGKNVNLADYAGKVVVLEWFNPECPFVRAAHTKGSLVNTAVRLQKQGVVYLAINSAAAGKQGHGADANRAGVDKFKLTHPVLLDESGAVGKTYGATNTPHLYVIDQKGVLVYRGAVDNSPDGEGESPEGGKLVSYLDEAVGAVLAGKPVKMAETKAYGCSVKYGT